MPGLRGTFLVRASNKPWVGKTTKTAKCLTNKSLYLGNDRR